MADVPHLSIPLRMTPSGHLAVNEQDNIDDVVQNVQVLLSTVAGSRIEVPEYGIGDLTFTGSGNGELDTAGLEAAIAEWEPRAEVDFDTAIGVGSSPDADTVAQILAGVRLT